MLALLASHNQDIYRLTINCADDIAYAIREEHLETIPVAEFDFWLTPSLRPGNRRLNYPATKMLLGAGTFSARNVPLLRGIVVVTARDHNGQLRSLTEQQIIWLAHFVYNLPRFTDWLLQWRLQRADHADRLSVTTRWDWPIRPGMHVSRMYKL